MAAVADDLPGREFPTFLLFAEAGFAARHPAAAMEAGAIAVSAVCVPGCFPVLDLVRGDAGAVADRVTSAIREVPDGAMLLGADALRCGIDVATERPRGEHNEGSHHAEHEDATVVRG